MPSSEFRFSSFSSDGAARRGCVLTPRGAIETPAFMPVGTAATVKAMLPESVASTGAQVLLSNTYHLMLRPGADQIASLGGLHQFMNWPRPILTDSGGFQVMSLRKLCKVSESGVEFRSHIDGSRHFMSPESSVEIQKKLGSDISMCFDECTPYPVDEATAEKSMLLSMRWAERSKEAFGSRPGFALFGIQQGSVYRSLRKTSSEILKELDLDGFAIGGLAVGEGREQMLEVLDTAVGFLPKHCPRYLMGVGKPIDIVEAVARGVDMFDCVLPTRSGRTGQAFTSRGAINIKNARFAAEDLPLEPGCDCPACKSYTRAYLHHAFKAREIIASMLLTWHNLRYYQRLMCRIRCAIENRTYEEYRAKFHEELAEQI